MSYADLTRNDANPIKRFLQRRRLCDALSLIGADARPENIIDFGAGDGELCRHLAARFPESRVFCYEPTPSLRQEAAERLRGIDSIVIAASAEELPTAAGDLVFCMEVFEHLPPLETTDALDAIQRVLAKDGTAVIGVPLEVFAAAMLKGMFRMARRYGAYDACAGNVFRAALGIPPQNRPVAEITAGAPYHYHHIGFDHRKLRRQLEERFLILRAVGSPAKWLHTWLNSEIYYVVRKAV